MASKKMPKPPRMQKRDADEKKSSKKKGGK